VLGGRHISRKMLRHDDPPENIVPVDDKGVAVGGFSRAGAGLGV
jgi:hypothetical protein